jgi:uncharacterized protein
MSGFLQPTPGGVLLRIKVQPRAPKHGIVGPLGDELKIKIAAAPVDSAANEALIGFLAEHLDCPRRAVEIVHGHKSPHKVLRLHGMTPDQVAARLQDG